MVELQVWLNKAMESIEQLEDGAKFTLKQLFKEVEWNTLSNGEKRVFGGDFKKLVNNGKVPNVIYLDRAKNNSAIYMKVSD